MAGTVMLESPPKLADVTTEEWQRLANRRMFFGHQSVGANLVQGIQEVLASNPNMKLQLTETADPAQMKNPGLYHANIGKNGAPESKLAEFRTIVTGGVADSGTAMLKYCYVDVNAQTDPVALIEAYRRGVDSLRAQHPALTVVHVTLPLRMDGGNWFHFKTVVRGYGPSSDRQLNLIRQRYNELLRQTYGGREPVFDLARLEALGSDGQLTTVRYKGQDVPVLAREWTYDGGHLNEAGRRRFAEAFLATLAKL